MSSKPMVSVIVPIYNVEKYLNKCIYSIVHQSYKNLEIILIVDGSSDHSINICKKYQLEDHRIILIEKENTGVSDSRNIGILHASGDLIFFADGDDWLPCDGIDVLVKAMMANQCDFCFGVIENVYSWKNHPFFELESRKFSFKDDHDIMEMFRKFDGGPCGKLYKRKIILDNNIRFDSEIKCMEDSVFNMQYFKYCNNAVSLNHIVYFYNKLNTASAMKKTYSSYASWKLRYIIEKTALFGGDTEEIKKEINRIYYIEWFDVCRHYLNLPSDQAVNAICNASNLFKNHFSAFGEPYLINKSSDNEQIQILLRNVSSNQYVRLYHELLEYRHKRKNIKEKIATMICIINGPIKAWFIFSYLPYKFWCPSFISRTIP